MAFKISYQKDFRDRNYKSLLAKMSVMDENGLEIRNIQVTKSNSPDNPFVNFPGDEWNKETRTMIHSITGSARLEITNAVKSAFKAFDTVK